LELSLFDISDLSNPLMVQHVSLSAGSGLPSWISSPAETDHDAFMFDAETGDVVIPVEQYLNDGTTTYDLEVLHLDGHMSLSVLGQITHTADKEANSAMTGAPMNCGLFIGDTLYSVAGNSVQAYELPELGQSIGKVPLDDGSSGPGPWSGPPVHPPGVIALPPVSVAVQPLPGTGATKQDPAGTARPAIPASTAIVATGSDAGTAPQVKVYDADTKASLFTLTPFDPNFTGAVGAAVGDVNGDGTSAIICAAGPGGANVAVYSGKDGSPLNNFMAFDPNFTDGVTVAAGDVNDNGFADIIGGADAEESGAHLNIHTAWTKRGGRFGALVSPPQALRFVLGADRFSV
jgi:hypothetical protein